MTAPFETAGAEPRWQIIYKLAAGQPVGATITYEQLSGACGTDFTSNRTGFAKAVKVLEREEHRTLVCITNIGYRVAAASEHEGLARNRQRRSRRQIDRAVSLVANVHKDELDPEQAKRLEAMETTLRAHSDMLRRISTRVDRQESGLRDVRRRTSATTAEQNERLDRLESLLKRHGITADPEPAEAQQ